MRQTILLCGAGCVALLLAGCGAKQQPAVAAEKSEHHEEERVEVALDQQRANQFEFAEAQMRSAARAVETTGTVGVNESRVARLRPLARGRVMSVKVRIGDMVRKGQEVLVYDNVELGEAVGQYLRAKAQTERTRTEAGVAARAAERARNLVALGGMARIELDRREAEAKNAEANVAAALAEQSLWREKLHRFGLDGRAIDSLGGASPRESSLVPLLSPLAGVVLKQNAAEGESIQPETQLFEIADTSTVWVHADLVDRDLASVRVGDAVTISLDAYPDERFRGRVTHISDTVDPESRTPKIRCEVANPDRRLKLDMFAKIQIPGRAERHTLMIPAGAVQQLEGKAVAFVRESPTAFAIRELRTGAESQGWVVVEDGVKEGEVVATRGSFILKSEHLKAELGEAGHSHD